jgi:AraC-like DNA-binding protein
LSEIALLHNINITYLKDIFKVCFDISPRKYVIKTRLNKSKELLENRNLKIIEIASMCGFSSASRYSESFKNTFGYLPSQYRKNSKTNS